MKNLREYIFWVLDYFKGSLVRKHYVEIKELLSRKEDSLKTKNDYLLAILTYATNNVEFYTSFKNFHSLNDFPVINKLLVKNNFSKFVSKTMNENQIIKVTTSGSTGTPFTIYKDLNKISRHTAENIYFNEKACYPLGQRLYYLRVWNKINIKSPFQSFKENLVMADISDLSSDAILDLYLKIKKDKKPKSILGFASALIELNNNITFVCKGLNIKSIISISEHLPENVRQELSQKFNCPVVSRYSNMENGFIANQLVNDEIYEINNASFIIEILDLEKDIPVKDGEIGRIIVTDLFNYAMPLIRYDTGDVGSKIIKDGIHYLTSIEGRKSDLIFNTNGSPISVHTITNTMWEFKELNQYQFIQLDRTKYKMKLNVSQKFEKESVLKTRLQDYLGDDALIDFEYVKEIPILNSGRL